MLHISSSARSPKASGIGCPSVKTRGGSATATGFPSWSRLAHDCRSTFQPRNGCARLLQKRHVRDGGSHPHTAQPSSHFFGGYSGSPCTPFTCVHVQRSPSFWFTRKYGFWKSSIGAASQCVVW